MKIYRIIGSIILTVCLLLVICFQLDSTYGVIVKIQPYNPINIIGYSNSIGNAINFKRKIGRLFRANEGKCKFVFNKDSELKWHQITDTLIKEGFGNDALKKWVDVEYIIESDTIAGKVKHFGTSNAHFCNALTPSFKFKSSSSRINCIRIDEMNVLQLIPNSLAGKMGLITNDPKIEWISFNGENSLAYIENRIHEGYLFKNYGISQYARIRSYQDRTKKELYKYGDPHCSELDMYFHHQDVKGNKKEGALVYYEQMISKINSDSLKTFFDLDYMGKYLALIFLFNDGHCISGENLRLILDQESKIFYPILRLETLGRNMKHYYNYTALNEFVFKGIKQMEFSPYYSLFKALIADESLRYYRDQHLYEMVQSKTEILSFIDSVYFSNYDFLYYEGVINRDFEYKYDRLRKEIEIRFELAKSYLSKNKLFISRVNKDIEIVSDQFVDVVWKKDKESQDSVIIKGINFDSELHIGYNKTTIKNLRFKDFKKGSLINRITKDSLLKSDYYYNKYK